MAECVFGELTTLKINRKVKETRGSLLTGRITAASN